MLFKITITLMSGVILTTYLKASSHKTAVKSHSMIVNQIEECLGELVEFVVVTDVLVYSTALVKRESTGRFYGDLYKDGKPFFKID